MFKEPYIDVEKLVAEAIKLYSEQDSFAAIMHLCKLEDPELANKLRSGAKGCADDFASYAWSGWDEPGITITQADRAAGFDAARVNLRLAIELERGDLPTSRAHWMVGAYYLETGA